ncbi:MAG TPA: GNAT family N-acetyltransferase [Jatrophihabitans sp.]|nr:GNAT family N-acetyltransferase [Jatrophihabitans sp.]
MTGSEVRVRTAVEDDLAALRAVFRRASLSNPADVPMLTAHPETLVWSADGLTAGRVRAAVARDGRVIGFSGARPRGSTLVLDDLFVEPDWMGRGVGRLLVDDVVTRATADGITRIEVEANVHAVPFYLCVGFESDGEVRLPLGSAVQMHRDLFPATRN